MAIRTGRPVERALSAARQANGKTVLLDQYSKGAYSQYFEVRDLPVVIQLIGITTATVRILTSFKSSLGEREQVMRIAGQDATINIVDNSLILSISGRYRAQLLGNIGNAVCVYGPLLTSEKSNIPQPSGAQANRPNLFLEDGSLLSHTIEVADKAWAFTAFGLTPVDEVEVLAVYGNGPTYREVQYAPEAIPKILTLENSSIILDKSGRYRFRSLYNTAGKLLVGNPTILPKQQTTSGSGGTIGPPGPAGRPGKDGQIRFTGIGPPGVIVGASPDDTYLDTSTGDIYKLT